MITLEDIRTWVKQKSVDPQIESELLFAIACVGSSLNPEAVSKKGAQGLFQFMPITQQDLRERFAYPFNPFCSVCSTIAASIYLAWLFSRFPNDINLVLIAWNWGYGNARNFIQGKKPKLPKETEDFVKKVLTKYREIKKEE